MGNDDDKGAAKMTKVIYTTAEMVKLVGVSYSTLHRWVNRNLLAPRKRSNGRGVWLEWTHAQLRVANRLAAKSRAGRQ